VRRTEIDKRNT